MPHDLAAAAASKLIERSGAPPGRKPAAAFTRVFADVAFAFDGAYRPPESLSLAQRAAYGIRAAAEAVAPSPPALGKNSGLVLQAVRAVEVHGRPPSSDSTRPPSAAKGAAVRPRRFAAATSSDRRRACSRLRTLRPAPLASKPRLFTLTMRQNGRAIRCVVWRGRTTLAVFTSARSGGTAR